ncbi:MAG: AAA family ATPase [Rhizobacter sp.]|nr:AAA family ATPase [Rhizobacter sp.]
MAKASQREVMFPASGSTTAPPTLVDCQTSVVVIGANGAGKSRLGSWLEFKSPQKDRVHRIAAQRSLVFPESASPIALQAARNQFYWAPVPENWNQEQYESNKAILRQQARYGSMVYPETAPLSDFDKLLTLLFSESYTALLEYEAHQRQTGQLHPVGDTLLRRVQTLWESVLPHRSLNIDSGEIRVSPVGVPGEPYSARALSDGERVIFYLVGQCLCAPSGAIIVVDEPEIHLHKAIQDFLWNAIEKARPDCTFVYLTHDLLFAADRQGATKLCVTGYGEGAFHWFLVPEQQEIPEDVYLEVLGSRKPVLFVEGTNGSHDAAIYRLAFPQFTVKPIGGCSNVVAATKMFRSQRGLHHLQCFGIVDRDYLEEGQIASYERGGVYVPLVAEVENLYLIPDVIQAVAEQLLLDQSKVLREVQTFVFDEFNRSISVHAIEVTQHKVALALGRFSSAEIDIDQYSAEFEKFQKQIDPKAIHAAALRDAQEAAASGDFILILKMFNKKDLTVNLGRFFEMKKGSYVEKVQEMAKRELGQIPLHLRAFLPDLGEKLRAEAAVPAAAVALTPS